MILNDLVRMTRVYCRDNNANMFTDTNIIMFLNQGIDRLRQYKMFQGMSHLSNGTDEVTYLPEQYHYLLALFASSRCYDTDERFYEGIEKRNEFESSFSELINEIESGNIVISTPEGETVEAFPSYIEYVKDAYFKPEGGVEDDNSVL